MIIGYVLMRIQITCRILVQNITHDEYRRKKSNLVTREKVNHSCKKSVVSQYIFPFFSFSSNNRRKHEGERNRIAAYQQARARAGSGRVLGGRAGGLAQADGRPPGLAPPARGPRPAGARAGRAGRVPARQRGGGSRRGRRSLSAGAPVAAACGPSRRLPGRDALLRRAKVVREGWAWGGGGPCSARRGSAGACCSPARRISSTR